MPELKAKYKKKVFGYEVRNPYPSEEKFFKENPHVGGMAAEDNKITLNPHSKLSESEKSAVASNEAARLYMRSGKYSRPSFSLTKKQKKQFVGTAYEADSQAQRETIVGRIVSGDPSAKDITFKQKQYATRLARKLRQRK